MVRDGSVGTVVFVARGVVTDVRGGTCFGYEVRSPLRFRYLREGEGRPLEVATADTRGPAEGDELVVDWSDDAGAPYAARLYRSGDGSTFRLWIERTGWYVIEPDRPRITVPHAADGVGREERLWGIPALLCFSRRGDLPLHAAVVEIGGVAVLLAGPSGAGKTTLAAAFAERGYRLLGEDLACVQLDGAPAVVPGPAVLRLRQDTAGRVLPRAARVVAEDGARVHLALADRGDTTPVPIAAVLLLRDGDDDGAPRLEAVAPERALPDLWALGFRLPGADDAAACFASLVRLVDRVPVMNLHRAKTFDALGDTVASVADAFGGGR